MHTKIITVMAAMFVATMTSAVPAQAVQEGRNIYAGSPTHPHAGRSFDGASRESFGGY